MNAKVKYTDGPIGKVRIVRDFLPPPSQLVFREDEVKVTMKLSLRSVAFFKLEASKADVPYQRMIRKLLDSYVDAHLRERSTARESPKSKRVRA